MSKFCSICGRDLPLNMYAQDLAGEYKPHCRACVKEPVMTDEMLADRKKRFAKHAREFDTRRDERDAPPATEYENYLKTQSEKLMNPADIEAERITKREHRKRAREYDPRKKEKRMMGSKEYHKYLENMKAWYKVTENTIRAQMDKQKGVCPCCTLSLYTPQSLHYPSLLYKVGPDGFPIKGSVDLLCVDCGILLQYAGYDHKLLAKAERYMRKVNG